MQAREVLHKLLIQTCGEMHAVRREALETMVWAGLTSQRMTVTGLGRAIGGIAREKHNIKRADHLLSNPHLQSEREAMYGMLAQRLVGQQTSGATRYSSDFDSGGAIRCYTSPWRSREGHLLCSRKCTVADDGEAEDPRQFLHRLQAVLPSRMPPILVTDTGFKTPWFQAVEASAGVRSRGTRRRYVRLGGEGVGYQPNSLPPRRPPCPGYRRSRAGAQPTISPDW